MPLLQYNQLGQYGIITGLPASDLPANSFTAGQNVRMSNGSVYKSLGHTSVFGTPSVAPYWLLPVQRQTEYYWVYAGLTKVYVWNGSVHTNITRQTLGSDVDYTATAVDSWNGGILGGIPILNNGFDDPQMWNPVSTVQRLQALTNWPANTKARVIRPYRSFLVAYDVTKTSTRYQRLVKWSHPADPGSVPSSWNEADPTKDAGEVELSETPDFIVDAVPLRSINMIYKEETTWAMQFVGPPYIFRFDKVFGEIGALTTGCICEVSGRHVVATKGDIVVHDGQQAKSIFLDKAAKSMASMVFNAIDSTNFVKARLVPFLATYEVWFIYPSIGMTYCDKALIWNYKENTFAQRDLPNVSFIAPGIVDPGVAQSWDSDLETWDNDSTTWDERAYNPTRVSLLMAGTADTKLYKADVSEQFDSANFTSYIERVALPTTDKPQENIPRYLITEVFPRMHATGPVEIYVGGQRTVNESVTWQGPFTFNSATDTCVKCYVSTPLPAFRLQSTTNITWRLDGFSLNVTQVGKY